MTKASWHYNLFIYAMFSYLMTTSQRLVDIITCLCTQCLPIKDNITTVELSVAKTLIGIDILPSSSMISYWRCEETCCENQRHYTALLHSITTLYSIQEYWMQIREIHKELVKEAFPVFLLSRFECTIVRKDNACSWVLEPNARVFRVLGKKRKAYGY